VNEWEYIYEELADFVYNMYKEHALRLIIIIITVSCQVPLCFVNMFIMLCMVFFYLLVVCNCYILLCWFLPGAEVIVTVLWD
jgi:hypothetical protein